MSTNSTPQSNPDIQSYQVIPRTLIFIFDGRNRVLLLKGSPTKKLWPNMYNGIGGHVQKGEDIYKSAFREIEEETGLKRIDNLILRGIIHISPPSPHGILIFVFSAKASSTDTLQSSAEGNPIWVNWQTIPQDKMLPDIPILLSYMHKTSDSFIPFIGHYTYNSDNQLQISISP